MSSSPLDADAIRAIRARITAGDYSLRDLSRLTGVPVRHLIRTRHRWDVPMWPMHPTQGSHALVNPEHSGSATYSPPK